MDGYRLTESAVLEKFIWQFFFYLRHAKPLASHDSMQKEKLERNLNPPWKQGQVIYCISCMIHEIDL